MFQLKLPNLQLKSACDEHTSEEIQVKRLKLYFTLWCATKFRCHFQFKSHKYLL